MNDTTEDSLPVGSVLERYRAALRSTSPTTLWEQALVIAYDALSYAANTGGISRAVMHDEDAIQAVNLAIGPLLGKWKPEKGNLATFLGPRVVGIAKRYRQTERRKGITGKAESLSYSDIDEGFDNQEVGDSTVFPDMELDSPTGIAEQLAYEDAPDGYEALPIEAMREQIREAMTLAMGSHYEAVRLFYGLDGPALSLREIAERFKWEHPEQVRRVIDWALKQLKVSVTKLKK